MAPIISGESQLDLKTVYLNPLRLSLGFNLPVTQKSIETLLENSRGDSDTVMMLTADDSEA
jgi:hypothetical protein